MNTVEPESKGERPIDAKFAGGEANPVPTAEPMPDDPWKNRSKTMRCMTCMFFVLKRPEEIGSMLSHSFLGRCRRHAPTMNGYPAVFETDWCGDHKIDENKI